MRILAMLMAMFSIALAAPANAQCSNEDTKVISTFDQWKPDDKSIEAIADDYYENAYQVITANREAILKLKGQKHATEREQKYTCLVKVALAAAPWESGGRSGSLIADMNKNSRLKAVYQRTLEADSRACHRAQLKEKVRAHECDRQRGKNCEASPNPTPDQICGRSDD